MLRVLRGCERCAGLFVCLFVSDTPLRDFEVRGMNVLPLSRNYLKEDPPVTYYYTSLHEASTARAIPPTDTVRKFNPGDCGFVTRFGQHCQHVRMWKKGPSIVRSVLLKTGRFHDQQCIVSGPAGAVPTTTLINERRYDKDHTGIESTWMTHPQPSTNPPPSFNDQEPQNKTKQNNAPPHPRRLRLNRPPHHRLRPAKRPHRHRTSPQPLFLFLFPEP